jgi:polar amino acid transport system substrate-binding protein
MVSKSIFVFAVLALLQPVVSVDAADNKNKKEIIAVYADNYPPYSKGVGEMVKGVLIDKIKRIFSDKLGYTVKHRGYPWARAQDLVRSGQADIIVAAPTDKRHSFAQVINPPLIYTNIVPIIQKPSRLKPLLVSADDVSAIRDIAVFCRSLGNGWQQRFYSQHNVRTANAPNIKGCLRLVAIGRTDITYVDKRVAKYLTEQEQLSSQLEILPMPARNTPTMMLFISKKSTLLSPELVKGLSDILRDDTNPS